MIDRDLCYNRRINIIKLIDEIVDRYIANNLLPFMSPKVPIFENPYQFFRSNLIWYSDSINKNSSFFINSFQKMYKKNNQKKLIVLINTYARWCIEYRLNEKLNKEQQFLPFNTTRCIGCVVSNASCKNCCFNNICIELYEKDVHCRYNFVLHNLLERCRDMIIEEYERVGYRNVHEWLPLMKE